MSALRSALLAGLVAAAGVALAYWLDRAELLPLGLEQLEQQSLDLRFNLRGQRPAGSEVAILAFDDRTRDLDPSLFERRAGWARMLRAAHAAGAKVIGVDALFMEPERVLAPELVRDLAAYVEQRAQIEAPPEPSLELLRRVLAETQGDQALAAAMREAGNVVLAMHFDARTGARPDAAALTKAKYGQYYPGAHPPHAVPPPRTSIPELSREAAAMGFIDIEEDSDRTVRSMAMAASPGAGEHYAALSVQLIARLRGVAREQLAYLAEEGSLDIGGLKVPLADPDLLRLNFRGPAGSLATHSLIDLVQGRLPEGALEGKIALIGYTYFGHDTARTPFGPNVPAVELHATAIDNMLRGDALRRSAAWQDTLLVVATGLAVLLLFAGLLRVSPLFTLLGAATLVAGYLLVGFWLFSARGLWLSWIGPLAAAGVVTPVCLATSYLREGLQRRRLRHAFSHYLSDELIEQLLADPSRLALGGERRDLTILFSDIRGFTGLAERIPPEALVSFLNAYLTPMTRRVLGRGGYLDKYIGDALMAIFGAPVLTVDHAARALACALDMQEELARMQPELASRGIALAIGIGISSGEVVVGNMGSAERFDYTAIGDAVNLSARLEGLCKRYGVGCLISEETRRRAGEGCRFREVDRVRVKGKRAAVSVFELLGDAERAVASYRGMERWDQGLAAFRAGELSAARAAFSAFARDNPGDGAAQLYLQRLQALGGTVPAGWDGVSEQDEK